VSNSLVAKEVKSLKICFVSSYPPNRARLSEYAKQLVTELANLPNIAKLNVLADQTSNSGGKLPENSKISLMRVWKQDNILSIF
jgi:hypothetical protein